jgi:DNA-binding winged helix-turn-helix (wHTH) protein
VVIAIGRPNAAVDAGYTGEARHPAAMAVRFLDCELDPGARLLLRRGEPVHLTPKALDLLLVLVAERPRAISKTELLERIWPGTFVTDASLARTVHEIRDAIGDLAAIRTVHGHGYAFAVAAQEGAAAAGAARTATPTGGAWLVTDGRAVPLDEGASTIGRDPAVAVPLTSPQASWHHARIDVSAGGGVIEDLGSKNGTMVNASRISVPTELRDGDVITIAGIHLVFRAGDEATDTKTTAPA